MAFDVFISYPHQDKVTADAACAALEAAGIRCWIAPRDIVPGMDWSESIVDAISSAKVMVLIFSGHSNSSSQIKREVERAVNRGVPIIPLRIENVLPSKALEYFISTPHWLDALTPPIERHLKLLVGSVTALLQAKSEAGASPAPMAPFVRRIDMSLLGWLVARGMPDSLRAIVLAIFAILTLAPFLGGVTVWSFGSTPLSLPTLPAATFWCLILLAPFWWLMVAPLIGASKRRIASYVAGGIGLSFLSALFHTAYPGIALAAISPNFEQTYQFGFIETQHSWIASHDRDGNGDRYCHFRTGGRALGAGVQPGCTLRVDKLAFDAGGSASIPERSALDIELYVGTNDMLPETTECVPANNWPRVKDHPVGAEVSLHGVIELLRSGLRPGGGASYALAYDYVNHTVTAMPSLAAGTVPEIGHADIPVRDAATFQISGWTLWGDPSRFQMDVLNLRINGRLFCGLGSLAFRRD